MEVKVLIRKDSLGRFEKLLYTNCTKQWIELCEMIIVDETIIKSRYHKEKFPSFKDDNVLYESLNENEILIPIYISDKKELDFLNSCSEYCKKIYKIMSKAKIML